jgi:hypothetical protein
VSREPKETAAAERARWLAELSLALDETHKLASELGIPQMHNAEAAELWARLSAARAQVKGLRLGRSDGEMDDHDPKWRHPAIWPKSSSEEER